jgi:hypothetical protein
MANQTAIAAVSRTLRTLLLDRMLVSSAITLAPPDVTVAGLDGPRVNLYLLHVIENAELKNQPVPNAAPPGAYGRPPLSLNLRYLVTTHSAIETQPDADLNAQTLLGDAMRVLHDFGNQIDTLAIINPVAGPVGEPILDRALTGEFERVKLNLQPAPLDELTRIWSAFGEANFRRSVIYDATVVQIETAMPTVRPLPVRRRRMLAAIRSRPVILDAYASVPPEPVKGEQRVRVGDAITIEATGTLVDKLYVRLQGLDPIRLAPTAAPLQVTVPDTLYPADLDHSAVRPIPAAQQLQPGPIELQLLAEFSEEGVEGGLDRGSRVVLPRRQGSNVMLLQLVPQVTATAPAVGNAATLLQVTGTRLWSPTAQVAEVVVGNVGIRIRAPHSGDPWSPPTPTQVQVPMADAVGLLPVQLAADPPYLVAVEVDGARSRDAASFRLGP